MMKVYLFALLCILALAWAWVVEAQPSSRGPAVSCVLTTTATTSTLITGCEAPPPGQAIYITDISVYGDIITAVGTPAQVQAGTGATCTTPTVHFACQHPATNGCESHLVTPVRVAESASVCLLDATVGSKWVSVRGFIGPK